MTWWVKKIVVRLRLFAAGFIGFAIRVLCKAQPIPGFDSGATVVLVPKPAERVLRASAGRGFGSHG
jgi:hypothetical protein